MVNQNRNYIANVTALNNQKMKHIFFLIAAFLILWVSAPTAKAQTGTDAVVGTWKNGEGTAHIQITKHDDNRYYGKIIWLKVPNTPEGKPKTDVHNPDEKLRNRPIKGLEILRGFAFEEENLWEGGKIYDPKKGKDYSCKMTLTNPTTLEVRGYIGISLIGRTDIWTRQ